jgi:hypothetical protein
MAETPPPSSRARAYTASAASQGATSFTASSRVARKPNTAHPIAARGRATDDSFESSASRKTAGASRVRPWRRSSSAPSDQAVASRSNRAEIHITGSWLAAWRPKRSAAMGPAQVRGASRQPSASTSSEFATWSRRFVRWNWRGSLPAMNQSRACERKPSGR